MANEGKRWEGIVRGQLESDVDCSVDRLPDPTMGYKGVRNICDFVAYKYPHQFYIEAKSCKGNTLPFSNITENQWEGLLEKSRYNGVGAFVLVWFVEHDQVVIADIRYLEKIRNLGKKSLNINQVVRDCLDQNTKEEGFYLVPTTVKRVNPKMDVHKLLEAMRDMAVRYYAH